MLPINGWMQLSVTPLEAHPNDPRRSEQVAQLPELRLTPVYRLDATLGEPLDLGNGAQGHRRTVPLTAGSFTGPEIRGKRLLARPARTLPAASAQRVEAEVIDDLGRALWIGRPAGASRRAMDLASGPP
jgi:Protein of unknown function (DUF3237)